MKGLFDRERRAVAAGYNRQPFITEREGLTAEARKRDPRMPSDASMAYAAAVKEPSVRRPRSRDRNKDMQRTGMTGLPGVVAPTRWAGAPPPLHTRDGGGGGDDCSFETPHII